MSHDWALPLMLPDLSLGTSADDSFQRVMTRPTAPSSAPLWLPPRFEARLEADAYNRNCGSSGARVMVDLSGLADFEPSWPQQVVTQAPPTPPTTVARQPRPRGVRSHAVKPSTSSSSSTTDAGTGAESSSDDDGEPHGAAEGGIGPSSTTTRLESAQVLPFPSKTTRALRAVVDTKPLPKAKRDALADEVGRLFANIWLKKQK